MDNAYASIGGQDQSAISQGVIGEQDRSAISAGANGSVNTSILDTMNVTHSKLLEPNPLLALDNTK